MNRPTKSMSVRRKRRTKRIYYGPKGAELSRWWTVTISLAKEPVTITGKVIHALKGAPGVTIGCGLSNVACDNASAFPHPVKFASFTKSTCVIIDRFKRDGSPAHGVLYEHDYKHITDANDGRTLKRMVRADPSIMEREFILQVPRPFLPKPGRSNKPLKKGTGHGQSFIPRGALQRAVRAGLIGENVARQIEDVQARKEEK